MCGLEVGAPDYQTEAMAAQRQYQQALAQEEQYADSVLPLPFSQLSDFQNVMPLSRLLLVESQRSDDSLLKSNATDFLDFGMPEQRDLYSDDAAENGA